MPEEGADDTSAAVEARRGALAPVLVGALWVRPLKEITRALKACVWADICAAANGRVRNACGRVGGAEGGPVEPPALGRGASGERRPPLWAAKRDGERL